MYRNEDLPPNWNAQLRDLTAYLFNHPNMKEREILGSWDSIMRELNRQLTTPTEVEYGKN